MVIYLILLLPLGQLGLTAILTKKVAVPPFVSEELSKSGSGTSSTAPSCSRSST